MITVQNISYKAGKLHILNDISFTANKGELLVVLGTNGAGKSTLLKAICNEIKPTTGNVFIETKNINTYSLNDLAKIRGVLKQYTAINLPFLVKEIVMMGRYPHFKGKETEIDFEVVEKAIVKVGIKHLAERNYLTLSGGEQQRVQLARVFAQIWNGSFETKYLLLDEPVNSLDISHQHNTLQLAKEYAEQGNCVIAVLHDLNLAAMYADKILLIKQGKVNAIGNTSEVLTDEIITDTFNFPAFVEKHPYKDCPLIHFGNKHSQNQETGVHNSLRHTAYQN